MILSLVLALTPSRPTDAATITLPYVFINGQTLPAAQLNGDFNAIVSDYNGNITNANVSATANIAVTKLNLGTMVPALGLNSAGSVTWASGVTGDANPRIAMYTDGFLKFGPGGGTAVDVMFKRLSSTQIGVRNAADSADEDFKCDVLTLGTFNTNGVLYTTAAGVATATATGGSGTKVLSSVSGGVPSFSAYLPGFGGDGSDGAVTISGSVTGKRQYNATTFGVNDGVTLTLSTNQSVINAQGAVTIGQGASGSVVGSAGGPAAASGGTAAIEACRGGGPAGGNAGTLGSATGAGGAGGGSLNTGGTGGAGAAAVLIPASPPWSTNTVAIPQNGSGGGGGAGATGGAGGTGGGRFAILAVGAITVSAGASLVSNGGNGSNAAGNGGGGGGGSGGVIILASQTSVTNSGSITATGGTGGEGSGTGGDGGGGAGGVIVLWSPSNTAGSTTVTGGSAGTGGTGGATAGNNGNTINFTGTPNLPLLSKIQGDLAPLVRLAHVKNKLQTREVASLYAHGTAEYLHLCSGSLTESCEAIGDEVELIPAA